MSVTTDSAASDRIGPRIVRPLLDRGVAASPAAAARARLDAIRRAERWLRTGAVLAVAAALSAHLAIMYAAASDVGIAIVVVDAVLAGLVILAIQLHIGRITGERRRQAIVEELIATCSEPRDIAGTATAVAELLAGSGLVEACVVSITQDDGGQRDTLTAVAADGYPQDWLAEAAARPLPSSLFALRPRREQASADLWLAPLAETVHARPWVARVPLEREDEVLGLLLLVARRRGALRDRVLLRTIAEQLAGALDHARLYQAAYERATTLEEQDARRREFLYAIAHELRSPLTSIQTFAEMLGSGEEADEATTEILLSSLSRGVDRLSTFVNELLDLGRVEESEVKLRMQPVDVGALLRAAEEMLRPSFMARKQELKLYLPEEPLLAMADERGLEQVLMNLLSNAHRFTPDRGLVTVRCSRENGNVHVEVQDSGPGIDPVDRSAIFDAFYRVQRDGVPEVPGSGLGLAVARRLTELQGGRIWVEDPLPLDADSTDDVCGSRFCLELVAAEPAPDEAT